MSKCRGPSCSPAASDEPQPCISPKSSRVQTSTNEALIPCLLQSPRRSSPSFFILCSSPIPSLKARPSKAMKPSVEFAEKGKRKRELHAW
jgi:hypothetical protein